MRPWQVIPLSSSADIMAQLDRPVLEQANLQSTIALVFEKVASRGDAALMDLTQQFDGVVLTSETLQVGPQEIQQAIDQLDEDLKKAIQLAYANIKAFHEAQKRETLVLETMPGVLCERRAVPIQKVGLYIPGGSAPLFSTVLMLAVPAQIAGCEQMVLCTPPNAQGQIHPAILFTAHLCGITKIYKLGGAQAIAAMTLGTAIVPKVYKLFGPGNQYVTAAKQYAQNYGVAIDMPAGPSEVLVVADHTASPAFVASDLLSQAEHGSDSQVVLLCTHPELIPQVEVALDQQLNELPRKEIAQKALNHARLVQVADLDQALEISNAYAPEHLILSVEHPRACIGQIVNAGSVFMGHYTPESAGDYASGTNHTLPTYGYARQYSGVSLDSFVKYITFQEITPQGLKTIGSAIEIMAHNEQLDAHKMAVTLRLKSLIN